jgi:aspartate-semialdehyde dehydrogenase
METTVMSKKKTYNVAVVGATGVVGIEMIKVLESRNFPVNQMRLFASARSKGKKQKFKNKIVDVKILKPEAISGIDVALFSAGAAVSLEFAPLFAKKGIFVIDNSSAWRMDPGVPLVVPEVNPDDVSKDKKIIANPNCSTIQMVVALKPIHDAFKIKRIRVATYQAVSGAGAKGIQDLTDQLRAWSDGNTLPKPNKIVHQIAHNLVPQIDAFTENGYTKEEMKMVHETQKIMNDSNILVSATCVRVPVFRSHSEAVWVETEKAFTLERIFDLLRKAPGVVVQDDLERSLYPMPIKAAGLSETFVGRIRKDFTCENGLSLWVVSDNLLKGAALNAIQIAELLVSKKIL